MLNAPVAVDFSAWAFGLQHLAFGRVSFFSHSRPLVFAHRGGCDLGPENTITAFDLGMQAGADGLELDVHLSADGIVVVHHDDTLDRTTNGSGPVRLRTAAELARVDAGGCFVTRSGATPFRAKGIGIPVLSDVLDRYPGVPIIVEMKVDSSELARAVIAAVRGAGAEDRVCTAGFGLRSLRTVRREAPQIATSACHPEVRLALYRSWLRVPVRHAPYGGYQVPEESGTTRVVSPRFIRDAHRAGLKVQVWTVDTRFDMDRLLGWGADALISNRPDVAVAARDAFVRRSPAARPG
jgi:glycerophosphoryl diester phosphodiesterase